MQHYVFMWDNPRSVSSFDVFKYLLTLTYKPPAVYNMQEIMQMGFYHETQTLHNFTTPSVPVKSLRFSLTVHYKGVGAGM